MKEKRKENYLFIFIKEILNKLEINFIFLFFPSKVAIFVFFRNFNGKGKYLKWRILKTKKYERMAQIEREVFIYMAQMP